MKSTQKFVLIFGVLMLGICGDGVPGQGAARHCVSEECACEEALSQNTVEAVEDFLRKYPQSVDGGDTACAALAVPPEDGVLLPEGQSHDAPEEPVSTPSEG